MREAVRRALVLAIALIAVTTALCAQEAGGEEHAMRLWAIEYGESSFSARFAFAEPLIIDGEAVSSVRFGWLFYLIELGPRRILVDTGFSDPLMVAAFAVEWKEPLDLLAEIEVAPESVTDVVITHHHFDHADNLDRFPNATIHINARERELLEARNPGITGNASRDGRIDEFERGRKIAPGVKVEQIGGHSEGSAIVRILVGDERIVLAGDEAYLPANIELQNPIGTYHDLERARTFTARMASSSATVFTLHDPEIVPGTHGTRRLR